jgi:hypothetical protein
MARMIRKQIYIEERQALLLKRLAQERGIQRVWVVREALGKFFNWPDNYALIHGPSVRRKMPQHPKSLAAQGESGGYSSGEAKTSGRSTGSDLRDNIAL